MTDNYFTLVFRGELSQFDSNPFHIDTPFGHAIAAATGNALADVDDSDNGPGWVSPETYRTLTDAIADLRAALAKAEADRDRAFRFAQDVWETVDPNEPVADNGMTAWDCLLKQARGMAEQSDAAERANIFAAKATNANSFQTGVSAWMQACFGPEISADKTERNHRFIEEALELVQACGCTQREARQIVDYVYGRPVGEIGQEVGGVMVTLAALCLAQSRDMAADGDIELARIWTKVEVIRAKQAAKPKHSPLAEAFTPLTAEQIREAAATSALSAEREECAKIADKRMFDASQIPDRHDALILRSTAEVECAAGIAAAIRARSQPDIDLRDDKIDGLQSDLDSALDVLWRRGDDEAREWVRLNYPSFKEGAIPLPAKEGK